MDIVSTPQQKKLHPHKFTLWVAMASIIMMFAGLTSAYIVKRNAPNWEEIDTPQLFIFSTVAIVLSSLTMQLALRAFKQREMRRYRLLISVTTVLGIAFVVLQYFGFQWMWAHGVSFKGAGQGQFLYVIAGLHVLHVIGGIVTLTIIGVKAYIGKSRNYNSVPVEVAATYWHFVDALWLYLLVFFVLL
jgi:cytochrome c oxidase subunit III